MRWADADQNMAERDTQEFIKALLSRDRAETLDPFTVLTYMPIDPYEQVADIGCGPGYFTIPLGKFLVHGKLYALDISEEMVEAARKRVQEANLSNVTVETCGDYEFPVPSGSLDGVLMAFVVHSNRDRPALLKAASGLLRPRGWCTVMEWHRVETEQGPPLEMRMEPAELKELAEKSGLEFTSSRELNDSQYMSVFRKVRVR